MPDWAYQIVAQGSAYIDAANNALNAGLDVEGAVVASCVLWPDHAKFAVR